MILKKQRFHVLLIKPSKYDDDGYVIRWTWGVMTSNSLACMNALTLDAFKRGALGADVEPAVHVFDETVCQIPVQKLSRKIREAGERAVACMVGVQTNQYARALDLALAFKKEGIPAMIGGFHVSGVLEMLKDRPPEIQEAIDQGITLVAGEVEARWGELLKAAYEKTLEPIYDFLKDKPELKGAPGPELPVSTMDLFLNAQTCFDAGRGCPFHCTFCTIINIQGNTMRGRAAEDIEAIVRANYARGHKHIFITDDNFARHKDWEAIADTLIRLKEKEGIRCSLMIQVDTAAFRIPRFIDKMSRAGVRRIFIGMESINPVNLRRAGKYHNQISEYRKMLQAWRNAGVVTAAGYIIGFPDDTYESIMRDVETLKREIPLDLAEFFIMTPLPGSRDHQQNVLNGVPMSPDTDLYDTMHVATKHPHMTDAELMKAYDDAWKSFYSKEHCQTLLLRRKDARRRILFSSLIWFTSTYFLANAHPLLGGFLRRKGRRERKRGRPIEPVIPYYAKRFFESLSYAFGLAKLIWDLWRMTKKAQRPEYANYSDETLQPVPASEIKASPASVLPAVQSAN